MCQYADIVIMTRNNFFLFSIRRRGMTTDAATQRGNAYMNMRRRPNFIQFFMVTPAENVKERKICVHKTFTIHANAQRSSRGAIPSSDKPLTCTLVIR